MRKRVNTAEADYVKPIVWLFDSLRQFLRAVRSC